jgi:branched-chain amino acid transport system permease protein
MQDVVNILGLASVYVLFALGMSLVWGTIGIVNFAHGEVFMFSAFVSYLVSSHLRLPLVVLLIIAAACGAAMSVLIQVLAFGPIIRLAKDRRAAELQILIGGIGIAAIPLAIAEQVTKSNPFGLNGSSFHPDVYVWGSVRVTNIQIITFIVAAVIAIALVRWVRASRTGLALRALGVDAETTALMGVNRGLLAVVATAIAGAIAGLAGVLLTFQFTAITPETGDSLLIKAFAVIVLGGLGSLTGTIFACIVLATCETLVLTQTSGAWVDAVSFGLIFVVLMVRPQGLFGRREVVRV